MRAFFSLSLRFLGERDELAVKGPNFFFPLREKKNVRFSPCAGNVCTPLPSG